MQEFMQAFRALVQEVVREELARARNEAQQAVEWLTTDDAAKLAHLKPKTIRAWVASGRLTAVRINEKQLRIRRADLDAAITSGGRRTAPARSPEEQARRDVAKLLGRSVN